MIKKIIGFLCSVIFCTAIAIGMPQMAKAEEEASMWITTDKLNSAKDDIITLTFTYTGTRAINAIAFDISFDNSLLEVYNYEPINRICGILDYCNTNSGGEFVMRTLGYDTYYIHNNEKFLSIQFKCLKDIDKLNV